LSWGVTQAVGHSLPYPLAAAHGWRGWGAEKSDQWVVCHVSAEIVRFDESALA
jgi:hypothetical protein